MSGKVTHFEVHGRDGKRLQDFYVALFGWRVDANNPMHSVPGGPRIAMFADSEGNAIGLLEAGSGAS